MWKIVVPLLAAGFAVGLGSLVGGFRDIDVNEESVRNAVDFAVNEHNRRSNSMYRGDKVNVVKAETQVVAGVKYRITVNMVRTNCRKNSESKDCGVPQDQAQDRNYQCTFTVLSQPWHNFTSLLNEKC